MYSPIVPLHFLALLAFQQLAVSKMETGDNWAATVNTTDIFQNLPTCARSCVQYVSQHIFVGNTPCESWGCVCSESTQGPNFLQGQSYVEECVKAACDLDTQVEKAVEGFGDICLVYSAKANRPNETENGEVLLITSEDYPSLSPCAKFVLNGCLDSTGTRNEPNCGPLRELPNWESYRGLAAERPCKTSECLCKPPDFDVSFAIAYDAGSRYCGMWLSTQARENPEYEAMQNVFATYCASEGYPPKDWIMRLIGERPNATSSNVTIDVRQSNDDGWTLGNKLQLGVGVGIGVPGLFVTAFGVFVAWRQYRWMKRAEGTAQR